MKINNEKKYVIFIDLDGTLLKTSSIGEISKQDKNTIYELIKLGHKVVLNTGRNWAGSSRIYNKLKLKTPISNCNGAYIHNPKDSTFLQTIKTINRPTIDKIFKTFRKHKIVDSYAITYANDEVETNTKDETFKKLFGINDNNIIKNGSHLLPIAGFLNLKKDVNYSKIVDLYRRKYKDLCQINVWSKGNNESMVIDVSPITATKGNAVSLITRYFGKIDKSFDITNTIGIGDGFNDLSMFEVVDISVSMDNSSSGIKKNSNIVTLSNKESGVSHIIDKLGFILKKDVV